MKIAWALMVIGSLCFFIGLATFFTGVNPPNIWIMLAGAFLCIGMGFLVRYGWLTRKELLLKVKHGKR